MRPVGALATPDDGATLHALWVLSDFKVEVREVTGQGRVDAHIALAFHTRGVLHTPQGHGAGSMDPREPRKAGSGIHGSSEIQFQKLGHVGCGMDHVL